MTKAPADWLARVRHDLVKRLLWPARDRREMGGAPDAGELCPQLVDAEGRPIAARALWAELAADAPAGLALEFFNAALERAVAAAQAGDVAGVLALEAEVEGLVRLVRSLEEDR
jgi:hypothetical protein